MDASRLFWRLVAGQLVIWLIGCLFLLWASPLHQTPFGWLLVGAVLAVGASASSLFIARMTRPLEELTRRVHEVVNSHGNASKTKARVDTIGGLAAALPRVQNELERRAVQAEVDSERLATVLASMTEGVFAVDDQERILFANPASRELLELLGRELEGRPLLEASRNWALREAVIQAFSQSQPHQTEIQSAGTVRRSLSLRVSRLPGSPCPGVVAVVQDLSEIRRLENVRREFVANVSHELKTPLAAIRAYTETLLLGALHDRENNVAFVKQIEEQSDRLYQLIMDLLHLSRVETGKEAFELVPLSIHEIVEICVQRQVTRASAKQIELVAADAADIRILADFDGFQTVMDNLISNAINYTPNGGQVRIAWRADDDWCLVEVTDTGIGIAPAHRDRVFERFYRVDRARSRELGGTGLGLAIVKHLVQAFGGTVSLQSELGKGSTFTVRIPRM